MVGNDHSNQNYYVFLVPDEGYSEISKLHDRRIKALCDELNSAGVAMHGQIDTLSVCSYDGTKITDLETFRCQTSL